MKRFRTLFKSLIIHLIIIRVINKESYELKLKALEMAKDKIKGLVNKNNCFRDLGGSLKTY